MENDNTECVMKFSIVTPFNRGLDYLKDFFESLKDQRLRIYRDEVDIDSIPNIDLIKGLDDLRPYLLSDADSFAGVPLIEKEELEELSNECEGDEDTETRPYIYIPYRDFEVVLVLDHPVCDPAPLCEEYGSFFTIRTVELKEGSCVAAARNLGMREAVGDYVIFVDSDDYLFGRALYFMDKATIQDDCPDVIYGLKIWTWYTRNGFNATYQKKQQEEENNSDADDSSEDSSGEETAQERDERMKAELSPEEYIEYRRTKAARRLISKRKGIRNVSALNIAIRSQLLRDKHLEFPERFRYYSDFPFVCKLLESATTFRKNYKSWYVKRKHGDPINFPSLAQEKSDERFPELLESYKYTKSILKPDGIIRQKADIKFINYYTKYFVTRLRRSVNDYWREERFEACRELVDDIEKSTLKKVSRYQRKLISILKKGDVKKTHRTVTRRLAFRKLLRCLTSRAEIIRSFYVHRFLTRPVREDVILFECFFGKSYGDNPRGIYEYISKTYPGKYKCVWSMQKTHGVKIPYKHKVVKRFGLRYAYYIARSKYMVFNTKQPKWMRKREEQVFLETWHGTPLKKLAFDMEDNFSASPGYKKSIYSNTRSWDYLIAANKFSSDIFKSCFMFEGTMLEYGYPRNDILHSEGRDELAVKIKKKLGIPLDKKTILYAPTWRDDEFYAAGQYKFTLKLDLPTMKKELEDEYVILLRTHYYIADKLDVTGMEGFAFNLSLYPDIADIYLISDICITDYSSVFFDYANLRRPMLFYTYDIDKYRDMLRGFYFDMEATVPGPLLYTTPEVVDAVKHIDEITARFSDRYDAFYDRFCGWEDGHASENIYNKVFVIDEEQRRSNDT